MNKKIVFVFAIICIMLFLIFYYIFCISGNNIIRNQNEFVEDILKRLENYEANVEVTVISNKNENVYNMHQVVNKEVSRVTMNAPENIEGLEFEIKDGNLKITNAKTNMKKIYENYKILINNSLFLTTFLEEYKNNDIEILENDAEIVIKIYLDKKNNNTYIKEKELYINKETRLPTKLLLKDNSQKINTSIIYNDIKIK